MGHENPQGSSAVLAQGKELQQPEVGLPTESGRHQQLGGEAGKDDRDGQERAQA